MRLALGLLAAALALGSCARIVPRSDRPVTTPRAPVIVPTPPPPAVSAFANAIAAGVTRATMPLLDPPAAERALAAFRTTCPALLRRTDGSGLTRPDDWSLPCANAATAIDSVVFFRDQFEAVRVGNGQAFATGYYEPEIAGSLTPLPGYAVPLYAKPADLVEQVVVECPIDFATPETPVVPPCKRVTKRGRIADNAFVPYYDRAEIEDGALAGRGLEIAWAADAVEAFFLEVQGSGRLRLPDGRVVRIGYAGQNGQPYTGIGALMAQRGLLPPGQRSMQGIMAWLRANPEEGRAIMRENRSTVFFRILTGAGAIGALNVPVTARVSVAADPAFVPLGAPVMLAMDRAEASGLWIAQDTGGAIKGANRFDTFWGAGAEARTIAGGMSARGSATLLLPRGSLARLGATP